MRLLPLASLTLPDGLEETGQRGLVLISLDQSLFLYAGTGPGGGIASWRIDAAGSAQAQPPLWYPETMQGPGTGLLGAGTRDGAPVLILDPGAGPDLPLLVVQTGAPDAITGGGAAPHGRLSDVALTETASYQAGPSGLFEQTASGSTRLAGQVSAVAVLGDHLLAASLEDAAVRAWALTPEGARATATLGADQGLGLGTPTALETVAAYGRDWVLVAAAGSQSLSVMALDDDGGLTATDHLLDTRQTRFGGVTSLSVVETQGRVFVLAGGADDGISLFTLLPNGRLLHLSSLEHGETPGLANVSGLTAAVLGARLEVAVASTLTPGVARYGLSLEGLGPVVVQDSPDMGPISGSDTGVLQGGPQDDLLVATGQATLRGGAGADILVAGAAPAEIWGGSGADLFVLEPGADRLVLHDFEPDLDRIDLSAVPFLRSPTQLRLSTSARGAVLHLDETEVEIISAAGDPLEMDDLFGARFDWPDRVLVLNSLQGRTVQAGPEGGFLKGSDGPDSLLGDSGNDILWSGAGDDWLQGGAGADNLGGQDGADTLDGGPGADSLAGGADADRLSGGAQDDVIYGGPGDDWLSGGSGQDMLGGSTGADTLLGGSGADALWGSWGDDSLEGGPEADVLGGFWGNDLLRGDAGADTLWGAMGDDTLEGGAGDDLLGGFTGQDQITGGAGRDQIWGASGEDLLRGQSGADTLGGGPGDDTLEGGGEADALFGGPGDDLLRGGDQADTLFGGAGDDMLWGGNGADLFQLGLGGGQDSIGGFEPGLDRLQIGSDRLDFDDLTLVAQDADLWIALGADSGVTLLGMAPGDLSAQDVLFGW